MVVKENRNIINVGRSLINDIIIEDPYVSKMHCQFIKDDNGNIILIDIDSQNGTYVNAQKIRNKVVLQKNDVVRIGNTTLPWLTYFNFNIIDEGEVMPEKPINFLVLTILSAIFCNLPLGIVSFVYASKVDALYYNKQYEQARDSALKAKIYCWIAFVLGVLTYLIYIICMIYVN